MSSTSFRTPIPSYLPSTIRHLNIHNSQRISFFSFAPSVGVILDRDIEGNLSGSKWVTMDNFHISDGMMKDGHFSFQTQLPKLKSDSLSLNLVGSASINDWTLSLKVVQFSVKCPLTPPWYSHLSLISYLFGYGGFLGLAGITEILQFQTSMGSNSSQDIGSVWYTLIFFLFLLW